MSEALYFLTDLDANAEVKGSRDPLGIQPIWTALGRRFVAHLTTVTTSFRGFSVLLLGLELAERSLASRRVGDHEARERERLACFLRFEQIAAYARYVTHQATDIRGINRVKRRLQEDSTVTIGHADRHQILAEQRTYGLWGLYTSAARGSGLVEEADVRPTPATRDQIEAVYLNELGKGFVADLVKRVGDEGKKFDPRGRDQALAAKLGDMLGPARRANEQHLMNAALVEVNDACDTTHGKQRELWRAIDARSGSKGFAWGASSTLEDIVAYRAALPAGSELADDLDRVIAVEPLLATMEAIFNHVVGRRSVKRPDLLDSMAKEWRAGAFRHLRPDAVERCAEPLAQAAGADAPARFAAALKALRDDDFGEALDQILAQNDAVMRARGGAGWLDHRGGELRARLFQHPVKLPTRESLPTLWRNSYFIDAVRWIGADIRGDLGVSDAG